MTQEENSVVIVGGGIIGIACAHYLSEAGAHVTVIDQGALARACSHANCGYICPSHILPLTEPGAIRVALKSLCRPNAPFRVKPTLNPSLWTWLWQFAKRCNKRQMLEAGRHLQAILDASMQEYHRLMGAYSLDCEWQEKGLLYVLQTERGMKHFEETDSFLSEHFGVQAQRFEGAEVRKFDASLKENLAGAFYYPGDTSVRPDRLNQAWIDLLRSKGVTLRENCPLTAVSKSKGRIVSLETDRGPLRAGAYVFAMGAWSSQWSRQLECNIPVQPGKGYSVTMPKPQMCPSYPMLFPEHKVGVSPFDDGFRLGSIMEFTGYDASIPDRRIRFLRDAARHYLKTPVDLPATEKWYGWRPMTWDSLPIIGRLPRLANGWLATGHNMLGLSLATSTGRIVAELITNRTTHIDPTPYRPERFD